MVEAQAVPNLTLPQFPTFNPSAEDSSTLFPKWQRYIKRFQLLCTAIGVKNDKQKLSILLTYVGDDTYEIYENLIPAEEEQTFQQVLQLFENHFKPQLNISYESYLFHKMHQRNEETLHQYYIRLKEQAVKCNFHSVDRAIKQQIELSTCNNKLRKWSFQNKEKTLQELLSIGKTFETTKIQTDTLIEAYKELEINAIKRPHPGNFNPTIYHNTSLAKLPKECYNCGGTYPHAKVCPAQGKTCFSCSKVGHFSHLCRSTPRGPPQRNPTHRKPGQNYRTQPANTRPLNHVSSNKLPYNYPLHRNEEYLHAISSDCTPSVVNSNTSEHFYKGFLFSDNLDSNLPKKTKSKSNTPSRLEQFSSDIPTSKQEVFEKPTNFNTTVRIGNYYFKTLVDSGASINVMNKTTFDKLNKTLPHPLTLTRSKTRLITYGNSHPSLQVLGEIQLLLETANKFLLTNFFLINTNHRNLLSGQSALALSILHFDSNINTCSLSRDKGEIDNELINLPGDQATIPFRLRKMIDSFRTSVFSGRIGQVKDYQVELKIDKSVQPVAQRERRIPFALREKVNKKLAELEQEGIIEDVTNEATPWINPLVIVPKGNDIRLCIDMRCANKAISRTRYPTPTVEDILIKVRGSQLFTKLDLNSAFHQLELSPDSRYITTFQSDTRIKRYKRLIFGVNSAQEELQHALREILSKG